MKKRKSPLEREKELVNQKFNHLTLISRKTIKGKDGLWRSHWLCICDCGKMVTRRQDYILQGKTQSCGCYHPMRTNFGSSSKSWKGHGEVSKQYMDSIQLRARSKNIECTITIEEIWELFLKQEGLCALTQLPLVLSKSSKRPGNASLDRKDSLKGYTIDNIWWVHKDVNRMKNSYSLERYIEICNLVANKFPIHR